MLVSFVIPVYNSAQYLDDCVRSILNQTYTNIEIIFVNDGSTDSSLSILEGYAKQDDRVKVFTTENNGCSDAINFGVNYAKGEYIARMDSDDICLPNRIERQLAYAISNNLDVCGSDVEAFNGRVRRRWNYPVTENQIKTLLLFNSAFAHPSVLIRSNILKANKYFKELGAAEDYDMWIRLAKQNLRFGNIPEPLIKYRVHEQQISISKQSVQHAGRNRSAEAYWTSLGMNYPVMSIVRFTTVSEVDLLFETLHSAQLEFVDWSIVGLSVWKMAMRSPNLGLVLYRALIKNKALIAMPHKIALILAIFVFRILPVSLIEKIRMLRPNF